VLLPDEIARPRVHPLLGPPSTIITPDLPPFQAYLTPSYELPGLASALAPYRSEEAPDPGVPATRSAEEIEIRRLQQAMGRDRLEGPALSWWQRVERRSTGDPRRLLRLLRKLARLQPLAGDLLEPSGTLLAEYFQARRRSDTRSRRGRVSYLAWSLIRQRERRARDREGPAIGHE
jgi:hypothetical protein